jgi:hypothetical protein
MVIHFQDTLAGGSLAARCGEVTGDFTGDRNMVTCPACIVGLGLPQRDLVVEETMAAAAEIANLPPESTVEGLGAADLGNPEFNLPWRCFHCDEVFIGERAAADHFSCQRRGISHDGPACVEVLNEGQKAIVEDRRTWRNRALDAEAEIDRLALLIHQHEHDIRFLFNGCKTLTEVAKLFDTARGHAELNRLDAERFRWLRSREPVDETGETIDHAIDAAMKRGEG